MISRPLSDFEHFFRSRTDSKFYNNFQVTATYSKPLPLPLIYQALRKTILQYPILICNIIKTDDCYFHPIESAQLGDLVTLIDDNDYISNNTINESYLKFINQIQFNLYDNSPLFRLVLLNKIHLTVVLEHTIADGLVAPLFHQIFFKNLISSNSSITNTTNTAITLHSEIFNFAKDKAVLNSLPPAIDTFLQPYHIDYGPAPDQILPPSHLQKWPGRFPNEYNVPIAFKLINFTPDQVSAILRKCKLEKVSLTSYLQIVHALTITPTIGNDHYSTHRVAISLRRFMNTDSADQVYLATAAHAGLAMNLPPITEFSWQTVRQVYDYLQQQIKNDRLLNSLSGFFDNYDKIEDNRQFFISSMEKPRADTVKLSNLGLFKFDEGEEFSVENLIFAQDVLPSATDFMLNAISTPLGGLNLVWSFFEPNGADSLQPLVPIFKHNILKYIEA